MPTVGVCWDGKTMFISSTAYILVQDVSKYSCQVLCSRSHNSSTPRELQVHLQTPTRCLSQRCTRQVHPPATVSVVARFCTEKEEVWYRIWEQHSPTTCYNGTHTEKTLRWTPVTTLLSLKNCCFWMEIPTHLWKKAGNQAAARKTEAWETIWSLRQLFYKCHVLSSAEQRQHTTFPGTIVQ